MTVNCIILIVVVALVFLFLCFCNSKIPSDLVFLFKASRYDVKDKSFDDLNMKLQKLNRRTIDLLYLKSFEDIQQTLSMRDAENKNIFSYTIILTALLSALFYFGKILFNSAYKDIFWPLLSCLFIGVLCLIISTIAYFKALSFQYENPRDTASVVGYDIRSVKINSIATNASGAYKNLLANCDKIRTCKIAKKYIKFCLIFYFLFSFGIFLHKLTSLIL